MKKRLLNLIIVCFIAAVCMAIPTDARAAAKPGEIKFIKVVTDTKDIGLTKEQKKLKYNRVRLYWTKASKATGYSIYYSTKEKGKYTLATEEPVVTGTSSGSYRKYILGFPAGKKVYLKVRPYNGTTKGKLSDYVSCVPGNVKANASTVKFTKYYKTLYIGTSGAFKAKANRGIKRSVRYISANKKIATVNKTTGRVTPKKSGKVKIYAIAHNGVRKTLTVTVKKGGSKRVNGVPTAPVLSNVYLRPKGETATYADVKFTFKTVKGHKYQILRKSTGKFKVIATIKATGSSKTYQDKKAYYSTGYTYSVREVEKNGTYTVYGKYDTSGIRTLSPIKGLKMDKQNLHCQLTWNPVSGAKQYTVSRRIGKGGKLRVLKNVTSAQYDDVYYDTFMAGSAEEKNVVQTYMCADNFVDPSINPFIYQIEASSWTRDSKGNTKYSYSYYYQDGIFDLAQSAIISYDTNSQVLKYSRVYCADGYWIYKGYKNANGSIVWTKIKDMADQSGTQQSATVPYDPANPYFTVTAYSSRNGKTIYAPHDNGFYVDPAVRSQYGNKKVLFLGNSITYGSPYKSVNTRHVFSYPWRIQQLLGIQYFNPSIPGSTYSLVDGAIIEEHGTRAADNDNPTIYRYRITRDVVDAMMKKEETGNHTALGISKEAYPNYPDPALRDDYTDEYTAEDYIKDYMISEEKDARVFAAYDVVIMAAGTNDYGDNRKIDKDETEVDPETKKDMSSAVKYIMTAIEKASRYRIDDPDNLFADEQQKPIKVVFMDFFYSDRLDEFADRQNRDTTRNKIGLTLVNYQNQYNYLIDTYYQSRYGAGGEKEGLIKIYHFKTRNYGFVTEQNCPYTTSDNLHMTRATYGLIGNVMAGYLKGVLDDNN